MLGISLLFVGFTLIHNGLCMLLNVDGKTRSVMNFLTGGLLFVINLIGLIRAAAPADYMIAASGLLFSFTYLLLGSCMLFGLNFKIVGFYGAFAALNAIIFAVYYFSTAGYLLGVLWLAWFVLWGEMLFEPVFNLDFKKITPILLITEGVLAAWLPAIYFLFSGLLF